VLMIAEQDGRNASIGTAMPSDALVLLGCGGIARRHAAAARRLGVPVIFASRDVGRARAYARALGGLDAVHGYDAALRDARATAVVVCTPHDRHVEDTLAALTHGKHVLVEKPIARTLGEADRMIAAASVRGRILMVAENFHWMPAFRRVRGWLDEGVLGPLREIHLIARGFRRHADWRTARLAMGGGTLIDGGIHYVHTLRWWGGTVRSVYALSPRRTHGAFEGEDAITVLATMEGDVVGLLSNSLAAPGVPRLQWATLTGADATCFADNRGRFVVVRGAGRVRVRLYRRDVRGHEAMLRAFLDAIATGRTPETDGASGRRDLAVVLAAYRSVDERRPIEVAA
jgi:UDP-N-acetyl-2-amino-2-deoxyglucuronate dehydrogenase